MIKESTATTLRSLFNALPEPQVAAITRHVALILAEAELLNRMVSSPDTCDVVEFMGRPRRINKHLISLATLHGKGTFLVEE